jgi:UDP-2,3-diacylglucosamine hydrolase
LATAFLAKSLPEREQIILALRQQSEFGQARQGGFSDGRQSRRDRRFPAHARLRHLIHGHTHRPARHDHIVDGIHVERWVMADWTDQAGECLCWDGETLTREVLT